MAGEIKMKEILKIGLDYKNRVAVYGQLADKKLCIFALTEAIKIVFDHEPPKIVEPKIHIIKPNG